MTAPRLGLVVGSGIAAHDLGFDADDRIAVSGTTAPLVREVGDLLVLARHGPGVPAHRVDHEANLRALRERGADRVLALGSTGSLRADWPVGTVVIPDDFFAPWANPSVFEDMRAHAVPGFHEGWRSCVVRAWSASASAPAVDGGVYVHAIGPRFETPAEIRFFATVGDLIGMTLAAECVLAAEIGLAYAAVCIVDNLANGVADERLTTEAFEQGVASNRARFARDVRAVTGALLEV